MGPNAYVQHVKLEHQSLRNRSGLATRGGRDYSAKRRRGENPSSGNGNANRDPSHPPNPPTKPPQKKHKLSGAMSDIGIYSSMVIGGLRKMCLDNKRRERVR